MHTVNTQPPIAAFILAAGQGRRLGGRPKATLQIGGKSVLERLVAAVRGAGVQAVTVVIGPYRDQLLPLVAQSEAGVVEHGRPDSSLIESQRLAIEAHAHHFRCHDLLLVLGDLPLITSADVSHLVKAWQQRAPWVQALVPMVDGVRGHPLLMSNCAVEQVSAMPPYRGIRDWLFSHPETVLALPTKRQAYVTDVDTPDDLRSLEALVHPEPVAWPAP